MGTPLAPRSPVVPRTSPRQKSLAEERTATQKFSIMFDVSWGEIAVLSTLGLVLIGRRDLPIASHALGQQIGRIVGLLQGARLRADRFATDHQLKQLQNEFKSGLRELDAVKAELAGGMMSRQGGGGGLMGGSSNLGALVSNVDRKKKTSSDVHQQQGMIGDGASMMTTSEPAIAEGLPNNNMGSGLIPPPPSSLGAEYLAAAQQAESLSSSQEGIDNYNNIAATSSTTLAPRSQSVAAVAEEEWEKRGIGFKSIAESGGGGGGGLHSSQQFNKYEGMASSPSNTFSEGGGGSVILSNYIRQSLIHDQYERTVREQDEALRARVDKVRNERTMGKGE